MIKKVVAKLEKKNCTAAELNCRDERTGEEVVILYRGCYPLQ
jgi:hypothetical protein